MKNIVSIKELLTGFVQYINLNPNVQDQITQLGFQLPSSIEKTLIALVMLITAKFESSYNIVARNSSSQAAGLFQIMPFHKELYKYALIPDISSQMRCFFTLVLPSMITIAKILRRDAIISTTNNVYQGRDVVSAAFKAQGVVGKWTQIEISNCVNKINLNYGELVIPEKFVHPCVCLISAMSIHMIGYSSKYLKTAEAKSLSGRINLLLETMIITLKLISK